MENNFVSYDITSAKISFSFNFGDWLLVHTFKIKKFELISSNSSRDIAKSLKISFGSSFVSPVYTFQTKKTALDYLYPFLSFSVHNFCARTDGQTFFEKVFFFLSDQEYIYMSIPISIIFWNFTPILPKVSIPFFLWKWVWKPHSIIFTRSWVIV